jgi:uncharacterized membrane protein
VSALSPSSAGTGVADGLEALIARLLVVGLWLAMGLILVGVALMLATGTDPLDHGAIPPFDLARIPSEMLALQPAGFLWAGIVLIIALPIGRVVVAGVGFMAVHDRRMALISVLVLLVVLASIVAAIGTGS